MVLKVRKKVKGGYRVLSQWNIGGIILEECMGEEKNTFGTQGNTIIFSIDRRRRVKESEKLKSEEKQESVLHRN